MGWGNPNPNPNPKLTLTKVVSEASMVADILLMKAHNFNAVRAAHCPQFG